MRSPILLLSFVLFACGGPAYLEPGEAGPDFAVQGEYGLVESTVGAQIVALGGGRFRGVVLPGGLPGAGHDGSVGLEAEGALADEQVRFSGGWSGIWSAGALVGETPDGRAFALPRIERRSPSLGAPPPEGAVVLFAEPSAGAPGQRAMDGEVDTRGFLQAGARSDASFGDFELHLEFRVPFMPEARGQARGNSGVYLQNRYEVQVLDSFGQPPAADGAGGIYGVSAPSANLSFPPLAWQTYDIAFEAARFDAQGVKIEPARLSVRHNGVQVQNSVGLPGKTGGGDAESPEPGPLYLQDHRTPVVYRNVWLVPR